MPGPKNSFPVDAQMPGMHLIAGSFVCDGANAPTLIEPTRNAKFTVSAPSTGKYIITLADGLGGAIVGVLVTLMDQAANSTKRAFCSNFLGGDGTIEIQTQSATGTDANLAAFATVSFLVITKRTSI